MREGAYDYLHKPFQPDEVTMTIRKAEEREKLRREVETLRSSLGAGAVQDLVVCESREMRDLLELARPGRPAQHHRPDHRRERHRQGSARPGHPPDEPAQRAQLRRHQLRRDSRAAARVRALRPRARAPSPAPPATGPACSSWPHEGTLLLDEIGDLPARAPGQAAPGAGGGRGPAGRRPRAAQGGRPGDRRHRQAAGAGGRARRVPRRPLLPPQRRPAAPPAAAGASGGHARAARPTSPARRPSGWATR